MDDSSRIEVYQKIGWHYVFNQPDSALYYFWAGMEASETHPKKFGKARFYNRIGVAYDIKSDPDSAMYYYNLCLEEAERTDNLNMIASTHNNMGLIYWNQGIIDTAMIYYKLAADGFEKVDYKVGLARALNNIGLLHIQSTGAEFSIPYFQKSLKIRKEMDDTYGESAAYANLGIAYSQLGLLDSTAYYYQKAIELKRAINDLYGLSKVLNNLGIEYTDKKEYAEAIKLYEEALSIKKKMGDKASIASTLINLAELNHFQGKNAATIPLLEESLAIAAELNDFDLLFKSNWNLAKNLAILGDYQRAYYYKDQSETFKDTIYRKDMTAKFLEVETQYETEKNKQQIKVQGLEIAAQKAKTRNQQIIGLALIAALLAIAMVIYYRFIVRLRLQRQQQQLEIRENLVQERERISRDLHDNVGAQLTQIINKLDVTGFKLDQGSDLNLSAGIEDISGIARETITQLRETIWAIQQDEFTLPQFEQRVRQYLNQYLKGLLQPESFELSIPDHPSMRLSSNQALNLFRIIQEATQNVVKHAQAQGLFIWMKPARTANHWQLWIEDNGVGFAAESHPVGHYGMQNMNSRARSMKGEFIIESSPGKGCTIIIEFPELKTAA
ncbi:MAG: sensor histidine kinase [Bacteroidota bacterium]